MREAEADGGGRCGRNNFLKQRKYFQNLEVQLTKSCGKHCSESYGETLVELLVKTSNCGMIDELKKIHYLDIFETERQIFKSISYLVFICCMEKDQK